MAAGRRRAVAKEVGSRATFERRTFLLAPGDGERPVYDDYVISHRIAAKQNAPELAFTIPKRGHPYPRSSFPAQLVAQLVKERAPDKLERLEEELFRAVFTELADVAAADVLKRCCLAAGTSQDLVDEALASRGLREQAIKEHVEAAHHGISGIPALLAPGMRPLVGAVPMEAYRGLVEAAIAGRSAPHPDARRGRGLPSVGD